MHILGGNYACAILICALLFRFDLFDQRWLESFHGLEMRNDTNWRNPLHSATALSLSLFLGAAFQLFDQTCHLELCHTRFQKAEGGGSGVLRMRSGVVFPSLCLKVSRAPGVSLSLTGDQLRVRRTITASFCCYAAITQPNEPLSEMPTAFRRAEILIGGIFFIWDYFYTDSFFFLPNFHVSVASVSRHYGARKGEELHSELRLSQWHQCSRFLQRGLRLREGDHRSHRRNPREISQNPRKRISKSSLDWIEKCWIQHCLHAKLHGRSGIPEPQRYFNWARER